MSLAVRAYALAALLLLGGCSLFRPGPPPEPETADQRECRQEANRSPEMARINREWSGNQTNLDRIQRERDAAFSRAFRDCMRARGLGPPGGVEPQIRR